MEIRVNTESKLCVRAGEENGRLVEGYGAVFDAGSKLIAEDGKVFIEHVNRNAFNDVLQDPRLNVIMNLDHDDKKILARSKSGTLSLSVDDYGLKYSFTAPNTTRGNDTLEMIARGDYYESSFRFKVKPSDIRWWREDGMLHREILKVSALRDCAIVVDGAYAGTGMSIESDRSYKEFIEKEELARQEKLDEYILNLKQRINDIK
jgi:HK97 family phage prohead protease